MKNERKYYYRFLCSTVLTLVATAMFMFVWVSFVRVNNQTNALMGYGNLGMAGLIYALLYVFTGFKLKAFKIGVERKGIWD